MLQTVADYVLSSFFEFQLSIVMHGMLPQLLKNMKSRSDNQNNILYYAKATPEQVDRL